nr:MAG TPA: baseplate component [Caudoviricetes sp.]
MYRNMGDSWGSNLRAACPGIIQSFDEKEQTVSVQLAIRELISDSEYEKRWSIIPMLVDVPIVIPRAGGYCLTMPIQKGDECLVVFGDMCIDAWWQQGNIQNQLVMRRHSLSDGFAILGVWSQPRVIKNYSKDSCQLRNEEGNTFIELKNNEVNINASKVNINGIDFNSHTYSCPHDGTTSGPS